MMASYLIILISIVILYMVRQVLMSLLSNQDDIQFYVTFYSSELETEIIRKYQKIQGLLSEMGGIYHFLMLLGFFISKIENKFNLVQMLSKIIYFSKFKRSRQSKFPKFPKNILHFIFWKLLKNPCILMINLKMQTQV